jgi:hypothetical protein
VTPPPRGSWAGAAGRLGVVGLLVAVALGLSADGPGSASDEPWRLQPPSDETVGVLALAGAVAGLLLLVAGLVTSRREDRPTLQRRSTVSSLVLLAVVVGAAALLRLVERPRTSSSDSTAEPTPEPEPAVTAATPDEGGGGLLLVLLLLAATLVAGALAARRRSRSDEPAPDAPTPAAVPADDLLGEGLAAAARSLRGSAGSEPQQRVIAAYAAFEDALAQSGLHRGATGTPAQLLERAVAAGAPAAAAERLTTLFTDARFAERRLTDADVAAAERALDELLVSR